MILLGSVLLFLGLLPLSWMLLREIDRAKTDLEPKNAWADLSEPTVLQSKLTMAGIPPDGAQAYVRKKRQTQIAGAFLGYLLYWMGGELWSFLALTGLFLVLPHVELTRRIQKRQKKILYELPSFLDLLTMAMESGMDLFGALRDILPATTRTPLEEEVKILMNEIRLGTSRKRAFENMSRRSRLPSLQALAGAVRQSEEIGSSLAPLLRLQTEAIRSEIVRDAEERAQRVPVKMLFPLIFFIFPVVLAILLGPLILTFITNT